MRTLDAKKRDIELTSFDHEPEINPDDTQPRPSVTVPASETSFESTPESAPVLDFHSEPPVAEGDTQPRPAAESSTDSASESTDGPTPEEPVEPSGCGNRLLIGAVAIMFLCLFVAIIGLAGLAGYRDGVEDMHQKAAVALQGTSNAQATLAKDDCEKGNFELCAERCRFVATAQPFYPGMTACISRAQLMLSATPTPGLTPTDTPLPPTPTATLSSESGGISKEEFFARGQDSMRLIDYQNAVKWLEALRGYDSDFRKQEVEDMLVTAYQALGHQYEFEGRLSEMIFVIKKALKIRALPDTGWEFTINAAQLYLDAKGYQDAGDVGRASTVFAKLMDIAPTYLNTKQLGCQAFASAGASDLMAKYGCQ
jgi:hypothetical protein